MRKVLLIPLLALCIALPATANAEVCVTDDAERRICLDKPATRVIPLYAAFTDILTDMGQERRIVARTKTDAGIPDMPVIGTHMRPSEELVLALKPDLVLQMGGRAEAAQSVATLEKLGIATAFFQVRSFDDLFSVVNRVGTLTGSEDAANTLIRSMRQRLDDVARTVAQAGGSAPTVFFEVRYPNLLGAGPDSLVTDIIRAAGGRNVLDRQNSGLRGRVIRVSEEELIRLDPEFYCIQSGPMNKNPIPLGERPHFTALHAARPGNNLIVDEHIFSRPGPRAVDAVAILARLLYPSLFPQETQQ